MWFDSESYFGGKNIIQDGRCKMLSVVEQVDTTADGLADEAWTPLGCAVCDRCSTLLLWLLPTLLDPGTLLSLLNSYLLLPVC